MATFADLHKVLSVAFGWANTHIYDFDVFDHDDVRGRENRLSGPGPIFKITDMTAADYNDDLEMYPHRDSSKVRLFNVLDDPKTKGNTIHYNYDFGDGWEHVISCTGRTDATERFFCLDGEGHGCAEDVGGSSGWKELLKAYDAQNPTNDQKELISWFETKASNKDPEGLRGEMKWRWDKDRINAVLGELDDASGAAPESSTYLHSVLLVSLDKQSFFDEMYSEVLSKLRSRAGVMEVTHISSAMQQLSKSHEEFSAVIVTDPAVMEDKFIAVQQKLVHYADAGGTVVLGFFYTSLAERDKLNRFFEKTWALNWKYGAYSQWMFALNRRANPSFMNRRGPNLPNQYSMKAVHLSKTNPEDRIYLSSPGNAHSPAVFANYGAGFLGWIGDVNTEIGTTELLLTMCGI
jgi:hypothetical protein